MEKDIICDLPCTAGALKELLADVDDGLTIVSEDVFRMTRDVPGVSNVRVTTLAVGRER